MEFQVKVSKSAKNEARTAYRWIKDQYPSYADLWYRGLMDALKSLEEHPARCSAAPESEVFPETMRQLLYGKGSNVYRILFTIRKTTVHVLYIRHGARDRIDFGSA